jgi:hypothetical protein
MGTAGKTIVPTALSTATINDPTAVSAFNWRKHLPVHPAAELFPLMTEAELKELASDIAKNGLRAPIVGWALDGQSLLDGRNRLDAMALLGLLYETGDHHVGVKKWANNQWTDRPDDCIGFASGCEFKNFHDGDPYTIALSLNVHRRHLTAEQKRELIAKVLKAKPEASNLAIAKQVRADDKTVAAVRSDLESRSEIPNVETRTDSKGRKQPATKAKNPKPEPAPEPELAPTDAVVLRDWKTGEEHVEVASADHRQHPAPEEDEPAGEALTLQWELASAEDRAAFLDAIGVDAIIKNMSPEFGEALRAKLADKIPPIVTLGKTVNESGSTVHALEQRGKRSRVH